MLQSVAGWNIERAVTFYSAITTKNPKIKYFMADTDGKVGGIYAPQDAADQDNLVDGGSLSPGPIEKKPESDADASTMFPSAMPVDITDKSPVLGTDFLLYTRSMPVNITDKSPVLDTGYLLPGGANANVGGMGTPATMPGGQYGPPLPGDRQPGTVAWQPAGRGADIRDKSAILGSKFVVTNQSGRVGDAGKKYGLGDSQSNLQSISDRVKSFEFAKDGCDRNSYFYLKDARKNNPDDAAIEYFIYMNDRAGNIFQLCKDGKVLRRLDQNGKVELSPYSVPSNQMTSQLLALTIDSAVRGGVGEAKGENHASRPHKVELRVYDPYRDPKNDTPEKIRDADNEYYYERFNMVTVDLSDYRNCLSYIPFFSKNIDNIVFKNEIIQAAFIGHFICELFSVSALRDFNTSVPDIVYRRAHFYGIDREIDIINDMTRKDIIGRSVPFYTVFDNNTKAYKYHYYPLKNWGAFTIRHYFPVVDGDAPITKYENCIIGANITLNENFIIPKDMDYGYKKKI